MELTRTFTTEQYTRALESWGFLDLGGKTPVFTSPFGDVFFQAADGFWWLDTLEGTLTRPWATADDLRAELNTEDGQDQYLLAGLAFGAESRGVVPGPDQVYSFAHPPQLGGELGVGNVEVLDFVVSLHILGQIHTQTRDLPPGTPISGFTVS
ncbi:hypothetical protein [Kribbella sp. NPDC000426]|uniref:hypothetical protein n=1 Tax=Kribbella sp. NPDC000426 TaxID=3154255 RepID=UPI00332BA940